MPELLVAAVVLSALAALLSGLAFARAGRGAPDTVRALDRLGERTAAQAEAQQRAVERLDRAFEARLAESARTGAQQGEQLRAAVEARLAALQEGNERKLEEMRRTVDEKLQGTLEQRLGESFRLVSQRLEAVHQGLGEMQVLAAGVGDLKRVLTNVKTRGTWGEVQLGQLLAQVLAPEQYDVNVAVRPGSAERVEFALKLPGRAAGEAPVWLPIDSKFPVEDYQRLVDAAEAGDAAAVEAAGRALEVRLKGAAQEIHDKYVAPPHTTDFGLLFLPTEGLYAEVLRRPGLAESLQRVHRVVVAGPMTLAALLNSLQMGFRTLAIERRSSEVWALLGAVKTEFGKFGEALAAARQKLEQAATTLEKAEVRTRAIDRKLRDVEAVPGVELDAVEP